MTQNNSNQPIYIMPEGYQRTLGREAQKNNILAAKIVAETVRTTLGPRGMDKMLVDSMGDVIVTNDGVTILREMQIEHPAAKMLVEVAKTQEEEVGDGTTTAVVLAGELLKNAEGLIEKNVHPTIISKGYNLAAEKAQEILNNISEDISTDDESVLKKIAMTAMTGKGAESSKELLSTLIVKAILQIANGSNEVSSNDIKIEKKVGSGIEDSELISGLVIEKERVNSAMPQKVTDAKVLLLDTPIEIKGTETDAKIQITSPDQMDAFLKQEETMIKKMTDKIKESGATVVFCQKGIDDLAQYYLAKHGIYATRRVKKSDMEMLARATGTTVVTNIDTINSELLGNAGLIEEVKVGDEEMTYVRECKNPKAVTILVRGGTEHVVAEVERAVDDAIGDVISAIKVGKAVGGAGSPEIELAKHLRDYANTLSGREQLAVMAFAESMEIIPRTLAENAGLDPIDILTSLKASHDKNEKFAGVDVFTGNVIDSWKAGIIEPLKIKTQAVKSASEVAELILRIDDVIASSPSAGGPGPGPMPGMGM
ncbi:thermosome subunit [Candidatus Woesearchaeota archaeon]|jgi:archaeal chaperonin|nr:thermosome subunit [Candidatus Woesearchaeota archaeon]MBT6401950.1 thermosome subunit [Candidatus Woesearchaeota archaeon]